MKRVLFILLAALMVMGTTQCKKKVEKYGPFVVQVTLAGADGKNISPFGEVNWETGDKVYAWGEDMSPDDGDTPIVLNWASGNEFYSDESVPNGSYNFFYFGKDFQLFHSGNYDAGAGEVYITEFDCQEEGTLEDISNRMHVMVAKDVLVTSGRADAVMENQIAIAYFDISALHENNWENMLEGSQLYEMLTVDLVSGECTPDNKGDIMIPEGGLVYLAFVPTDKTTLEFKGEYWVHNGSYVTQQVTVPFKVNGNPYIHLDANNFYTAENFAPIRVASCLPTSVVLSELNFVPNEARYSATIYTTGTDDFPEWFTPDAIKGNYETYLQYANNPDFNDAEEIHTVKKTGGEEMFPTADNPLHLSFSSSEQEHYYVRAVVMSNDYYLYSNVMEANGVSTPTVSTLGATNIQRSSATVGGNISSDGGSAIISRGVKWGTSYGNLDQTATAPNGGSGAFSLTLSGLQPGTTYYYKAFAENTAGESYGDVKSFTTQAPSKPTVQTNAVVEAMQYSAVIRGNVTDDGGATVYERGFCWSTSSNPSINDDHVSAGAGTGLFTGTITGLTPGYNYYVRAYAKNSAGTSYGESKQFTTPVYYFSVSGLKEVIFSPGNLQVHKDGSNELRFAEHQYDIVGEDNIHIQDEDYNGWIDLFSYGRSNYPGWVFAYDQYYSHRYWDEKSIAGDPAGTWRALTKDELVYLLDERDDCYKKLGKARVNNLNGLVILPDNWTLPEGCTFSTTGTAGSWYVNNYSIEQWEKMEGHGAVFLPAAGIRDYDYNNGHGYSIVSNVGVQLYYWTEPSVGNTNSTQYSKILTINEDTWDFYDDLILYYEGDPDRQVYKGCSVRLVKDY